MERLGNILRYLVIGILLMALGVSIAIQIPAVQKAIVQKAINAAENNFDADILLGRLHFKPFNTIVLKDVAIIDRHPAKAAAYDKYVPQDCEAVTTAGGIRRDAPDTLFSAERITARFSLLSLMSPRHEDVIIKELKIKRSTLNLVLEKEKYSCNLTRILGLNGKKKDSQMKTSDVLRIKNISLDKFRFTMYSPRKLADRGWISRNGDKTGSIDWDDLDIFDTGIHIHNFTISHGYFTGRLEKMCFKEKSGWELENLSADVKVGMGHVLVNGLKLSDGLTELEMDLGMDGIISDYPEFCTNVILTGDISQGVCDLRTLARFAPGLRPSENGLSIDMTGKLTGTVNDLETDKLKLHIRNTGIGLTLDGKFTSLNNKENLYLSTSIPEFSVSPAGISYFVSNLLPSKTFSTGNFGKGQTYSGSLSIKGHLNGFHIAGDIAQSGSGRAAFDIASISIKDPSGPPAPTNIYGKVSTNDLDMGKLVGMEKLGPATAKVSFHMQKWPDGRPMEATIDSLRLESITYNGYAYNNINGSASLMGDDLSALIYARDPALDADFTVWSDKYAYNGAVTVKKADLAKLDIGPKGKAIVQTNLYARMDKDLKAIAGNASLTNNYLISDTDTSRVDDMSVTLTRGDSGEMDILLEGAVARAEYHKSPSGMTAHVSTLNTASLLSFLLPGAYIEYGTEIVGDIDDNGQVKAKLKSGRLAFGGNFIKDANAVFSGRIDSLRMVMTASNIRGAGLNMNAPQVDATLSGRKLQFSYAFRNQDNTEYLSAGKLGAILEFGENKKKRIEILPSFIKSDIREWTIPAGSLSIDGQEIIAQNIGLSSNNQYVFINGEISPGKESMMKATVHNFDLGIIDALYGSGKLGLDGVLNAEATLHSSSSEVIPPISMELAVNDLKLNGTDLGFVSGTSVYDHDSKSLAAVITETIDGRDAIIVEAGSEEGNIDASIVVDNFPLSAAQGFLSSVFSRMEGGLSGDFSLRGPVSSPQIKSERARLDNAMLEVAYSHVPYYADGPLTLDNNGAHLDGIELTDRYNGKGSMNGSLLWDNFRNPRFNVSADLSEMEVINIPATDPGYYHGKIFATGNVNFSGPLSNMLLKADVTTAGESSLHISIPDRMEATKTGLLTFVNPYEIKMQDAYETILQQYNERKNKKSGSRFGVKVHMNANPFMKTYLDLGTTGFAAGAETTGSGAMDISVDPSNGFSILGDYILSDGQFDVNASSIVRKRFKIIDGSSIKFGGAISESILNIDAEYQTKTSIAALIADTTSVASRREVDCGIKIQDRLNNPSVSFSIDIPDLEPSIKSSVESALNTEDKVQKQFLALLLSNCFLLDEQSGVVNNTSNLFSSVSEVMANQFNHIFNRLEIPLDLGLSYQPSDRGTDIFDVALSTQLFNNRVIVGGSVSNRQNMSSGSESVVGDLDVQVKLNRPGSLRMNAFSHSADQYTNYLDNSQRNGVGVTWQKEFNIQKETNKKKTIVLDE